VGGGWNPFCFIVVVVVVVVVVVCTVARKLRGWEEGDGVERGGRFGQGEWGRRWRGLGGWRGLRWGGWGRFLILEKGVEVASELGGGRGLLGYYGGGTTCVYLEYLGERKPSPPSLFFDISF